MRVPLASGLLTGLYNRDTQFGEGDHRFFNRDGSAFDHGETFSGIPYVVGLEAVEKLRDLFPGAENLAPHALRWILDFPEVSTVIPGASRMEQVVSNLKAASMPKLDTECRQRVTEIYDQQIKPHVHQYW